MLGSFIGPRAGRETFLRAKIAELSLNLDKLDSLHAQHALLILRLSYQQKLRHLQRCLDTSDLGHVWAELDTALWNSIISLRSSDGDHRFQDEIMSLPIRSGGMGILSHEEVAPIARAAADEMADITLKSLLEPDEWEQEGAAEKVVGQSERCLVVLDARREVLLAKLTDKERKGMRENGSPLGRLWLSAIPWTKALQLTNQQISVALHYRTLLPLSNHCNRCGKDGQGLGHPETCNIDGKYPRHNMVVRGIGQTLSSVRGVKVELEPTSTEESLRRNDLRVWGSDGSGLATSEHDIKVYSIFSESALSSFGKDPQHPVSSTSTTPIWDQIAAQMDRYLRAVAAKTRENAPSGIGKFSAVVMTSGGFMEKDTKKQMDAWEEGVKDWEWAALLRGLSLGFVRARARSVTWE